MTISLGGNVDPNRTLSLTYQFAASRADVWSAFTDASQLREWWGPFGLRVTEIDFSPRVGAPYYVTLVSESGERFVHQGMFNVVREHEYLEFTWCWTLGPLDPTETIVRVYFADGDQPATTCVRLRHGVFSTQAERDKHVGWEQGFTRLRVRWS